MNSSFLLLDTSTKGKTLLALGKGQRIVAKRVFRSRFHLTDTLLQRIDAFLKAQGVPQRELGGIIVVVGPGPFSALRGAVTIANSLAFALRIPAAGLQQDEFEDCEDLLLKGIARLAQAPRVLLPHYGQNPRIS